MPADLSTGTPAPEDVYAKFGIRTIINCVGYATRVSGSSPHPEVIAAMAAASARYVEIDDVLAAASDMIHRVMGAEAGIITSGAGAALTLAAASVLTGNNPDLMDQLPDTSNCPRNEIIFPAPGPFDYDHALRLSGAKLILLDYQAPDALQAIERHVGPRTAAIGWVWYGTTEPLSLDRVVELAHRHGLPVIVDGAFSMPPVDNLTALSRRGADLIAYSGGKHLGGPQASGILCGRKDLIRNAWVQMVDMDVRMGTWSLQHWVEQGWISRAPRHGIGRSMKISKEGMIGLMTALARYQQRDHAAEYAQWAHDADQIFDAIGSLSSLKITRLHKGANGQPYALLQIESGAGPRGLSVRNLILKLRSLPRKVILAEDERTPDRCFLYTQCLQPGDTEEVIAAIRQVVASHENSTTS